MTDASGAYSFTGVADGTYYLELRGGSCLGVTLSPQDQGSDDALDSDFAPANYRTANFSFSGGNASGYDLGIVTPPATVSGTVWFEADFDGLREGGELGVGGVAVYLFSQDCVGFWFYRPTDTSGDFTFTNFLPATSPTRRFRLYFSRPGDRFFTKQDQGGDDAVDSDVDPTGYSVDFAILPGDSLTGMDAGLVSTSVGTVTIGDRGWSDLDADGLQDAGEPGLGVVPIRLWGGNGAGVISTSGTGPSGSYSFANLPPGKYLLEYPNASCFGATVSPKDQGADDTSDSDFNPPSGSSRTDPFEVYAGADGSRDLGLIGATSSLSGRVFFDADGDGVRDAGEPGIAGVTVTIDSPCWGGIRSVATDSNGDYSFPLILARPSTSQDYRILFSLPNGYYYTQQDQGGDDTTDSDADTAGYTAYFDAPPGGAVANVDAGLVPNTIGTVRIGDRAWYDADADGLQDPGEPGMTGPSLRLESANGGYLGERYPDVDGWYEFSGTSPGYHRLRHYGPSCLGVSLAPFDVGGDDSVDSDFQPGLTGTSLFSAGVGLNHQWDLGVTSQPASVAGRVWQDLDGDGVQDVGESGVGGYPVTLYFWSCGGSVTVYTRDDGTYSFPNVMPTTVSRLYRIVFGWAGSFGFAGFSPIDQGGDDTLDSDVDTSGYSTPFTLPPGSAVASLDAGLLGGTLRSVGDRVWQDQDANGVQDAGESGVDGVVVRLLAPDARSIAETTTAGGGAYTFGGLAQQTYSVEFQLPAGFAFTLKDQGSDASDSDADASTGRTASFYLSATSDTSRDAGLVPADPASVGDRVWLDLDGDGVQDAGEGGVANVTVTLRTAVGAQVSQTATDASGSYVFNNLLPGDYKLVFSLPSGFLFSPQDQGGDDALDSDSSPVNGETAVFTLVSGGSDTSRDVGLIPDALATVGDYVWDDLDRDGIQDAGEPGLAGISVELFTSGGSPVGTTTTNGSGAYSFSGLASGDYYVEFTLPALYEFSPANQTSDALDSDADPVTGRSHTFNLALGEDETSIDAGMRVVDSVPPRVANVDSVAPSGGSIDEGEVVNVAITVLLVTFDEAMDEVLAETLGNYLLVEAGPNETLETAGCAPGGDDAAVVIDSATHAAGTTTLGLNGGADLAEGVYALVACAALEDVVGNALDGDGDGNGGDDFVRTFTVDRTSPRVDSVDSFADTGDGILSEGEATNVAITQLVVTFDEPVADPTGDTAGDDVTNPANWLLIETGVDSTFDTVDCATGADLDDVALAVDAVSYDEATHTATLDLNAGTPLSDGLYRLVACGTTSIVDLGGNPLDGDGDATGGDDFTRTFRVDTTDPDGPASVESTGHVSGGWVTATQIAMTWSGASDAAAGLAGYSVLFDDQPSAQPDASVEVAQSSDPHGVTSPPLVEGAWYFHLVTCDLAGSCTEPVHRGPYGIDTTAPSAPGTATSASHGDGLPKADATIEVAWGAATDVLSGIDGYSFFFDGSAVSACGATKDVEEGTLSATSAALADGTWYVHVCAVDNAGNWGAVVHGGPYVVDSSGLQPAVFWSTWNTSRLGQGPVGGPAIPLHESPVVVSPIGVAVDAQSAHVYWVDWLGGGRLRRSNLDGSGVVDLRTGLSQPHDVALELAAGKIYWTVRGDGTLRRSNLDGTGMETVLTVATPYGLALDPNAGVAYFGNLALGRIQRVALDGTGLTDVISAAPNAIGVAVDPTAGKLYWSEYRDAPNGVIRRADLDGSNAETLVTGLAYPNDLALDLANGWLYWAEQLAGRIGRAHLDGTQAGTALAVPGNPEGVALLLGDVVAPTDPTISSTAPLASTWSSDSTVEVTWSGAADEPGGSGLAGYSVLFDGTPTSQPDAMVEMAHTADPHATTSAALADGTWYFHLSTCDVAGNCTATVHAGPFWIDATAPSAPGAVTSSSHGDGLPKSDATIDIAWGAATDALSGVALYRHGFTGSATQPSCSSLSDTTAGTSATSAALADGAWYAHVCAVDGAGNEGPVVTGGPYAIDSGGPTGLVVVPTSHTVSTWSNDSDIDFSFSGATDLNGIAGYSVVFDQAAGTDPDTTVDQAGTSYTGTALSDGSDWYLHVRACDTAGNCGATVHDGPFWIDTTAPGAGGGTVLVSHTSGSLTTAGNSSSFPQAISGDGRYVAFESTSTDLLAGYSGSGSQVFLWDRDAGAVTLVSHAAGSSTTAGNGFASPTAISADGRYVLFRSFATDLVAGGSDTNGMPDAFLWDRDTGLVTLVSHASGSATTAGNDYSEPVAISADGRYVAFRSNATDLIAGYSGFDQAFLWDRDTGTATLVSHAPGSSTTAGNTQAIPTAISADGRYVLFRSFATDLVAGGSDTNGMPDSFLWDRDTGLVTLVSHASGSATTAGNDYSEPVAISADGRYVSFRSYATDLIAGYTGSNQQAFVWDRDTGTVTLVSHESTSSTTAGNGAAFPTAISADGQYVAFSSSATNLVAGGTDTNGKQDAFLWARDSGTVTLVSHDSASLASAGNDESFSAAISADGRYVAFSSSATNLVAGGTDTNGTYDALLWARDSGAVTLVSHDSSSPASAGNDESLPTAISADGRYVAVRSIATNLVEGGTDTNGIYDVFLWDRDAGGAEPSFDATAPLPGIWSNDATLEVTFSGAADNAGGSGLAGYSVLFDQSPATQPDSTVDIPQGTDPHVATSAPLADGNDWYFHLSTCDVAGNCTSTVHAGPFWIDTTAPSAPGTVTSPSHGDGLPKSDATIDVAWGAATDGLSGIDGYSYFFDGTAVSACETTKEVEEGTTSATSSALADGTWYVHVCAVDNAGNWGAVAHGGPYVVDTAAPTGFAASSSSHAVSTWSNDATVDFGFSGAADANGVAGYSLAFDQAAATDPDTTIDQGGTSYTGTAASDGDDWYLHVRACDTAGNCGTTVHAGPYWIDTTSPSDPGAVTSSSHDGGPSNDDTIDAEWGAASDASSGVASYRYAFATNAFGSPACADLGEATAATSATSTALAEGTWYLHVCAEDGAGNRSGVATGGPYVIDATSPQVANVDSVVSAGGSLEEGEVTNVAVTQLLLAFDEAMDEAAAETLANYLLVAGGPNTTLDTTGCTLGGDDVAVTIDTATYSASTTTLAVNGGAALADGRYALFACAALQDPAGNALDGDGDSTGGDDFVRTFEVDTAAPAVVASRIADNGQPLTGGLQTNATVTGIEVDFDERMADPPGDGGAGDVDSTSSYRLVFDPTGAFETDTCDDGDPGDDVDVAIDAVVWNEGALRATAALNGGAALGDGWYRFFACAALADRAGNALAAELVVDFQVDTQAPTLPSTLSSTTHVAYVWSGIDSLGMLWSGAADEPTGSGLSHYELSVDALPAGVPDGSWTLAHASDPHEVSAGPLAAGVWYFHLVACDAAGNCAGPQHAGPYLVDFTGPLPPLSVVSPSHDGGPSQDPTIDVIWTPAIDDASGLAGYAWEFSTVASWNCDEVEDGDEASASTTSAALGDGAWYFHLCARDNAGNWGAAGAYGPWTVDTTGPSVASADSVPEAGIDGLAVPEVGVALTELLIGFDEAMAESGAGSVTDVGNWRLVAAGPNGTLETNDCAPLGGDDVAGTISSVGYDAGSFLSAVSVGDGTGLGSGRYRLLACSTLNDLAGNGLAGTAWSTDLVVVVDPLLGNPNFDADASGWSLTGPQPADFSWQGEDGEAKAFSGSLRLETVSGVGDWYAEQCVELGAPGDYAVRSFARVTGGTGGEPLVRVEVVFYDGPSCTGANLGSAVSADLAEDTAGAWLGIAALAAPAPVDAVSARASLEVSSGSASSYTVELDRAFFGRLPDLLSDGFESGDTCQWTQTSGGPTCP